MDHFRYIDGSLHGENVRLSALAERVGTPCFVYSKATLVDHYQRLAEAFAPLDPLICYSIKSSGNLHLIRTLAECGAGMDLVSGGELHRALAAGVDPAHCVYAGVGKTETEILAALSAGIGWFNVESAQEFEHLASIARRTGVRCRAALRINPEVEPGTHEYTATGKRETKFGVALHDAPAFFAHYGRDEHALLRGLHLHIGSPIYSPQPYVDAIEKALTLIDELRGRDHAIELLDIGGGFGADYVSAQSPPARLYAERIVPLLRDRVRDGLRIVLEPGRTISANAGVLLVKVLYRKTSRTRSFVICDGGMNVLLRPSHYQAFHFIWPTEVTPGFTIDQRTERPDLPGLETVDVVGPICESGDFLARDRALPPVKRGDVLAVFAAGAYGMSMASRYNSMPLPPEIMVDGARATMIRQRESYDDLVRHELNVQSIALTEAALASR